MTANADELRDLRGLWWVYLLFGLLSAIGGVVVLVWPGISLVTLAVVTGILLLIDGVFEVVASIANRHLDGAGLLAVLGVLSVIAGVLLVKHPFSGLIVLVLVLGAWFLASAVVRFIAAFSGDGSRIGNLLVGLIDLIAGIVIIAVPGIGLATLAILAGVGFLLRGIGMIVGGLQLRKLPAA